MALILVISLVGRQCSQLPTVPGWQDALVQAALVSERKDLLRGRPSHAWYRVAASRVISKGFGARKRPSSVGSRLLGGDSCLGIAGDAFIPSLVSLGSRVRLIGLLRNDLVNIALIEIAARFDVHI